ncbi:MAG TPA: pseudouridine synthase [Chloroflexota bacterium]|nr:pseudouridine synthase [Chloroflexota bacterium]
MRERLQKVLAASGYGSRRAADEMIARGEVSVNGVVAQVGQRVDPDADRIEVAGAAIPHHTPRSYLALNKPVGYVSSRRSTHGERTVMELLPRDRRLFPVGRLDLATTGLLLITNDGEWANLVTHPRFRVPKRYVVSVEGRMAQEEVRRLRHGVVLPDGETTSPAEVRVLSRGPDSTLLSVTVVEGRKRQIRLMAAAVGHPVLQLERTRIDGIELGRLGPGKWRHLTSEEIENVRTYARRQPAGRGGANVHTSRD